MDISTTYGHGSGTGTGTVVSIRSDSYETLRNPEGPTSCRRKIRKFGVKRLPILSWLPKYKRSYIFADMIAGVTVWLTAVPQSMAYAAVAGLTPEYGLYSHFWGPILYIFLGSCRQVTIGPTAVVELLTYQTCGENYPACVVLMGFYSGLVELVFGLMHLGLIISFISEPVTVGFTAGAASTIASAQIKNILGLRGKASKSQFIYTWKHIIEQISTLKLGDTVLGVASIIVLLVLQKIKDLKTRTCCRNPTHWTKVWGTLALTRNALVVFTSSLVAFMWCSWSSLDPPFALTGDVQSGFPPVTPPSFELLDPRSNSTQPMTFIETLSFFGSGPVVVAFIAILQNVAISKSFGSGQTIDGTQEMIALGATNIIGGFFSCIPVSGSFTRSVVNDASGVKSQLGGLFVGILMLLSLAFLTPSFQYIPKASLAAVVICAVIFMIEFKTILLIWKMSKMDFFCCLSTFLTSLLLGMELGILIGVGISVLTILLKSLQPSVSQELLTDEDTQVKYVLLKPDQGLYFPSVDFIRDTVNKSVHRHANHSLIVIQCDKWTRWDFTAVSAILSLVQSLKKSEKTLILYKYSETWVDALKKFGAQSPNSMPLCFSNETELSNYFQQISSPLKTMNLADADSSQESTQTIKGGSAEPLLG